MRPMTGRDPVARHPVHCLAAARAVEHEPSEIALEVGLHLQKLEAKHLRLEGDGVGAVQAGVDTLIDDRARGCVLLAHGSNGTLKGFHLGLTGPDGTIPRRAGAGGIARPSRPRACARPMLPEPRVSRPCGRLRPTSRAATPEEMSQGSFRRFGSISFTTRPKGFALLSSAQAEIAGRPSRRFALSCA